jgi:beta-glucosidase
VQVYVRDKVSSVTTPLLRLAAFGKVRLAPGASTTITLTLAQWRLSLHDAGMRSVVEPGEFEILAGPDAAHLQSASVTVLAKDAAR